MADAAAFDTTCQLLEERTSLDRLEARGTVRLALKHAGLEARSVSPGQMCVTVERVLPAELASRGVADPKAVCDAIAGALHTLRGGAAAETPESVFARLGGT